MRSRQASAATARAFALVMQPSFDRGRAGLILADTVTIPALYEALAHLGAELFDDDHVSTDAADVLCLALELRRHDAQAA